MITTQTQPKFEIFTTVAGIEYSVKVENSPALDGPRHWVSISRYQPEINYWQCFISESVCDCEEPMEAAKTAIKRQRNKMCNWLDSWRDHRFSAAREKGGKKAYYSKHANAAKKWGLIYAEKWKVARAIWKGITKL